MNLKKFDEFLLIALIILCAATAFNIFIYLKVVG